MTAITKHHDGYTISLLGLILMIVAYCASVAAAIWAAGVWYGNLNSQIAALKEQAARQEIQMVARIAADEATKARLELVIENLVEVKTLIAERTERVEAQTNRNSAELKRTREAVESKLHPARRSLTDIIGITKERQK